MVRWVRDEKRRQDRLYEQHLAYIDGLKQRQNEPSEQEYVDNLQRRIEIAECETLLHDSHRQYDEISKQYRRRRSEFPRFGGKQDRKKVKVKESTAETASAEQEQDAAAGVSNVNSPVEGIADDNSLVENVTTDEGYSVSLPSRGSSGRRRSRILERIRKAFRRFFSCTTMTAVIDTMSPNSVTEEETRQATTQTGS
jgi:hypothetical protein